MNRLASRKLVVAAIAMLAIAVNRKFALGLTPDDIQGIVDVALTAIGSQAGIDLSERIVPALLGLKSNPQPSGGAS